MATADQSFKSLLSDLIGDVGQLIRQELRLAQAEASQQVSRARHGATSIVGGAMHGVGVLLILLQDRKSVVEGKSVLVHCYLGGFRHIIQKQHTHQTEYK